MLIHRYYYFRFLAQFLYSMALQKIVLKGTGKISLHERFTQLKFEGPHSVLEGGSEAAPVRDGGVSRYSQGASRSYPRSTSPQYNFSVKRPSSLLYSARERSVERNVRNGIDRKPLFGPSSTMIAAARIKRKSIHQRLGVRARLSLPRYRMSLGGGSRWGSTGSLSSNSIGSFRLEIFSLVIDSSNFHLSQKVGWFQRA